MPRKGAFEGKICWITGASSGIGEALAYELSRHGAILVLSARRESELRRVAETCRSVGAKDAEIIPLDVLDFPTHKAAVERVISRFGRIDYLVNNAGRSQRGLIENTEIAVDRAVMELNLFGTISLTKAVLPQFLAQPTGGVFVNTSSVAGKLGTPCGGIYAASKHAVQGYFDSLRMELADRRVRVVNICPGPVESQIGSQAFSEAAGAVNNHSESDGTRRVSAERCAALMAAAMKAELPEAWIAPQPILLFTHVAQYFRGAYFRLGCVVGPRRVAAFRGGRSGYASVQNLWSVAGDALGAKKAQ